MMMLSGNHFPGPVFEYLLTTRSTGYVNELFTQTVACAPQGLNAPHGLGRFIHADDIGCFDQGVAVLTPAAKGSFHSFTCRVNRKETGYTSWHLTGRVLKYGALGQVESILFFVRDIDAELQQVAENLELERKIMELRRSNKDLEEFAYIASHDMHEPLRKVHSFAGRLKAKLGVSLEEEANGYLNRIIAATDNARLMLDGLMEFSRLSRNGFGFQKVNMNELLLEVLDDLELIVSETGTRTEVGPLPSMEVIPSQMKQLFTNLMLNAIKFRKDGILPVVNIQARRLGDDERVLTHSGVGAVHYEFTITDNGIGFENEYAETIFQMFQRLNGKSEYPGSGIGLALCKKITDNHHGTIAASGIPGTGVVITIMLPEKNTP